MTARRPSRSSFLTTPLSPSEQISQRSPGWVSRIQVSISGEASTSPSTRISTERRGCTIASSSVMRPAVDEALHEGVVDGDLGELAVAEEVDARVADVGERDLVADPHEGADGGAHAGELRMLEHRLGEQRVGGDDAPPAGRTRRRTARLYSPSASRMRLTAIADATSPPAWPPMPSATTNSVVPGVAGVLVVGADLADVGDGRCPVRELPRLPPQLERWSCRS